MTSQTKPDTQLDLSGIVDGQSADAVDVTTPLNEAEDQIDAARSTLSVSAGDTHVKNLEDALVAGSGISISKNNTGADESLTIAATNGGSGVVTDVLAAHFTTSSNVAVDSGLQVTFTPTTTKILVATSGSFGAERGGTYTFAEIKHLVDGVGGISHTIGDSGARFYTSPVQDIFTVTPGTPVTVKMQTRRLGGSGNFAVYAGTMLFVMDVGS